ncbi:MAG: mannose-1-phosphate guanylyltransferase/mannose-6-phosphate isomerase [Bdellovibrionaceae bacterium]|nr:mannose-1-phosphate guanylyltransferase/mannose-6-phosphate isomerase [Pseudobdellovibrionaceae bacterium]
MIPLVLSGGSGTRLWPISRRDWPKQHCDLFGESLQSLTFKRSMRLGEPWLMTGVNLKTLNESVQRVNGLTLGGVIYEPQPKNTAAAVGLFCRVLELQGKQNEIVGVFPADHLIQNEEFFLYVCKQAETLAQKNLIVTLGITPTYPETGYGYIQTGKVPLTDDLRAPAFLVEKFHEKPDFDTAKRFLSAGRFSWNAGIFIFRVQVMIESFKKNQPGMWASFQKLKPDQSNLNEIYAELQSISLDYAIMERLGSNELACLPVEIGWSDVGSWDAVSEKYLSQGLPHVAKKEVLEINAQDNFVFTRGDKKVVLVGLNHLIVVETPDAILITQKGQSQDVKKAVESMQISDPELVQEHTFEVRPWGDFEVLRDTPDYKSKVLHVSPHSQISYQSHGKREEHWIITRGQGEVVLNDKVIPVRAGSHVHIPLNAKHRIRNNTDLTLEFVEVQLGTYFGEDDIVRYQDDYQRI